MSPWLARVRAYTAFALLEYVRSGRVLVEATAVVVVLYVFFWPHGAVRPMVPGQFFEMAGLFTFALAAYTGAAFARRGNRPDGYVVLVRPLGRAGYLVALFAAATAVTAAAFGSLSLGFAVVWRASGPGVDFGVASWALGALAILLEAAAVAAYAMLATPLVTSARGRIAALGLLALAANLLTLAPAAAPGGAASALLRPLAGLVGGLVWPATAGFALALSRDVTAAPPILAAQAVFAGVLFGIALGLFRRRDLVFPA